jgi:hypothetical protein
MKPITTFSNNTSDNLTAEIYTDTDPESPRDWCNIGTMVCWHSRYTLGDEQPTQDPETWLENFIESTEADETSFIRLPLYLYDHSGLAMSRSPFLCRWDSGQVGWIYCERGTDGLTDEQIEKNLIGEVEIYSKYLSGEVYGIILKDGDEEIDSCWGFYGLSDAESEAQELLNAFAEEQQ